MTEVQNLSVAESEDGMRLDRWFKQHFPQLGFSYLQKLLRKGQIRVDGSRVKTSSRLESGQVVRVPPIQSEEPHKSNSKIKKIPDEDKEFIQSLVIHKDDDLIVLNKPSGLSVQGGTKTEKHIDGLLDALKFDAEERPRLVHRLDKDTSGVLIIARNRKAATLLGKSFSDRKTKKIYWALVNGVPRYPEGEINQPLVKKGRIGEERIRPAERDDPAGMKAVTHYKVVDIAAQKYAWLAMMPVTGRTHQLRVHAQILGHPIVGDYKYGHTDENAGGELIDKLHLHASYIEIPHPRKGLFKITAKLPQHMDNSWDLLHFTKDVSEIDFDE